MSVTNPSDSNSFRQYNARAVLNILVAVFFAIGLSACEPSDRTPGLWLSGEETAFPEDWSFTQDHKEIYVEVATPYFISHSVTIWCAALDGALYIGARDPDTKNWPAWVDNTPDIRLKIGDQVFDVRAEPFEDAEQLIALRSVYASKYDLPPAYQTGASTSRYWKIVPRS